MGEARIRKAVGGPVDQAVGSRVRRRRQAIMITQGELGELLGVGWQDVEGFESGADRISARLLVEIARVLDVPLAYFFSDMDKRGPPARPLSLQAFRAFNETYADDAGRRLLEAFARVPPGPMRRLLAELIANIADGADLPDSLERLTGPTRQH